ncbi:MAG: DCC1-like thiol-disulfide oxidoreductase family protein [Cycloclasticus sp.]|jgi:predicted DCC family thiol-disulfide oxidoreductase YuxK|nr:DCC1-like thiol-disulfide oxidoreductase family protein [Cycloclasticus sp.]
MKKSLADHAQITVFYDQSCPSCVKDRALFERLAGKRAALFSWFDITSQDQALRQRGIDPFKALRELHIEDTRGAIHSEMDAYSIMMKKIPILMPLGVFICLPGIKPVLSYFYRRTVEKRLTCESRL